jgi:hypothetical protein
VQDTVKNRDIAFIFNKLNNILINIKYIVAGFVYRRGIPALIILYLEQFIILKLLIYFKLMY